MHRWWVLAICVALALGADVIYIRFAPPKFVSIGQMIVNIKLNIQQGSLYTEELGNFLGTQTALMQGQEVVGRAQDRASNQFPAAAGQPVALQVTVLPKTTIFILRATGRNPDYTKAFLQGCMEEYGNLKKGMAEHTSDTTIAGLTDQMLRLEPEMTKIDDQLAAFLATNNVALLQEATSVGAYLTALYEEIAEAQAQLELLNSMTLDQNLLLEQDHGPMLAAPAQTAAAGTANNLPVMDGMENQSDLLAGNTIGMEYLFVKQQILLLKADQERFAQYLKPQHPRMVELSLEIEKESQLLNIYRDQSVDQLNAKKNALTLQIGNLQNQLKQWGKENVELSRKSAQYQRIQAKGDRLQALDDQLLATLETLDVNKDINQESVTIYQPASDAFPDKPNLPEHFSVAGLIGLGLGMLILMLLDRLDDRMNSFTELEELFEEDVLGQIPREKSPRKNSVLPLLEPDDPRHPFVEAYRNLRSSLFYTAKTGTRPHTLLVTSSVPDDGKSVTAANLAITLAMGGSRVLLVDADLRKGTLHSRFNIEADTGLSESLTQGLDWRNAVKKTATEKLFLLPRGATTHRSSELFIGPVMEKFLQETIKEYDCVLIDTAPVMAADDVTSLAPRVDGVIFVVRAEYTSARVARTALNMLYQRNARVLGLVFNSVRASAGDYYNYYRYRDYYSTHPAKK